MSADNALALREVDGLYVVTYESASAEALSEIHPESGKWFADYDQAIDYIYEQYDDPDCYYEYGPWLCVGRPSDDVVAVPEPQQFVMVVYVDDPDNDLDIDYAAALVNSALPNNMSVRPLSEVIAS